MHVLGTPPALILSQDQTLHQESWCPLTHRTPKVASRVAKFQIFWLRYAAHAVRQCANPPSGFPEMKLTKRANNVRRRVLMLRLRRPPPATQSRVPQAGPSACQRAFCFCPFRRSGCPRSKGPRMIPTRRLCVKGFSRFSGRSVTTRSWREVHPFAGTYSPSPVPRNVVFCDGAKRYPPLGESKASDDFSLHEHAAHIGLIFTF